MKTKSRITSIIKANSLDFSVTGIPNFNLSALKLAKDLDINLPSNIRLGHLAERIVAELVNASSNYKVLHENVQLTEGKTTIGEIDFIIEELDSKEILHIEMAYKFYLFDPSISSKPFNNWIGPNRNDSLKEKLEKLKNKQFPLLYHNSAKSKFSELNIDKVTQTLCLFVSLFIPFEYKGNFSPVYKNAIKGYYLNLETFISLDNCSQSYYLPSKKEWGIEPSENENWISFKGVEKYIQLCLNEKKALLCWQKSSGSYQAFFIVWW
jgi:hypothetical protein